MLTVVGFRLIESTLQHPQLPGAVIQPDWLGAML